MGKITELPVFPEYKEVFTCKRCGCNLPREVVVISGKLSGYGLGFPRMEICANCLNGTNLRD